MADINRLGVVGCGLIRSSILGPPASSPITPPPCPGGREGGKARCSGSHLGAAWLVLGLIFLVITKLHGGGGRGAALIIRVSAV